jgi:siroheme decarboxylase
MPPPAEQLDPTDLRLVEALQQQTPLTADPFGEIARSLEIEPADALHRAARLCGPGGIIRQISAIFDSGSLGYRSSLVAARVDETQLDHAAQVISDHPGVSHNYRRNHAYNLWFTLAVPPDSRLGLERTLEILAQRSGAQRARLMPSLKMYKIGVKFDLSGEGDLTARSERAPARAGSGGPGTPFVATETDRSIIRALQQHLPLVERPFDVLAGQAGVSTDELLGSARRYLDRGIMRRFAAVLRHRQAGFGANAMGVWVVPSGREDEFGGTAASFDAVSHCYRRPTHEDWPYSVFTMVHGTTPEACEAVLAEISRVTGVSTYASLYSTQEYKKVRLRYFTPDIAEWEASTAGASRN